MNVHQSRREFSKKESSRPIYFMEEKQMKFTAEIKKVFDGDDKLKAIASVILDDCFIVKSVRVVDGSKGMFISLPSRRNVNGDFMELCFPLSAEVRRELTASVLAAYQAALEAPIETIAPPKVAQEVLNADEK